jgi:hypothetical protein
VASRVSLALGQSVSVFDPAAMRCTELLSPTGKYVVVVVNTSATLSSTSPFILRGTAGTSAGASAGATASLSRVATSFRDVSALPASPRRQQTAAERARDREDSAHFALLEMQRRFARNMGSPLPALRAARASRAMTALPGAHALSRSASVASQASNVGDTVTMKIMFSSCNTGDDVRARVVYKGTRSVILEDITSQRVGTMDPTFQSIGAEFDTAMFPILQKNFGNPLAMDAQLDNDGRITMLFTRYINDSLPTLAGYVINCNFFAKSQAPASNVDEVFYARLPNNGQTPEAWRRSMRATIIHESKHITAYAERLSRGLGLEESWLEESTARVSEELYSRRFAGGGAWKGNVGYATSIGCELSGQCDDRPILMYKHFDALYDYYTNVDSLTPLGRVSGSDFTFYGSGWSLVRWLADQFATDEGTFFRAIVAESRTGMDNLVARAGHPADEILSDWALTAAVARYPSLVPQRPQLSILSWNMVDMFRGLNQSSPSFYTSVYPLKVRPATFGNFLGTVNALRAGTAAYFELSGSTPGSQLLELASPNGTAAAPTLRLAIMRVQ